MRRWQVWLSVLPPLTLALAGTVYLSLEPSELWPEPEWEAPPEPFAEAKALASLAPSAAVDSASSAPPPQATALAPRGAAPAHPLPREVRGALAMAGHELAEEQQAPPPGAATALLQAVEHAERGDDALQIGRALEHLRRQDGLSAAQLARGLERASLSESRVAILRALALSEDPKAPEILARQAERDPEDSVRQECLVLLVSLGEQERAQAFLQDLSAREPATFARFGWVLPRLPALRPLLVDALRAEPSAELARTVSWSLAAGRGPLPDELRQAALAPDERALPVTEGLVRALPRTQEVLRRVATQAHHAAVRACALRGLVRGGALSPAAALALSETTTDPELTRLAQALVAEERE